MRQKNKGITLIALVITIIVLLILAGVAISTLTGDNGILTKAVTAKKDTENASAKERIQIEVMASYREDGILDVDTLRSNISAHIPDAVVEGDTFPITVTLDGQTVIIDGNGNVEIQDEIKDKELIEAKDIATNPDIFKRVTEGEVLNYGDTLKVTDAEGNQVDLDVEWKVFYAEGNDIYLIASDYVPVSKLASQKDSLGFTDNGNYNIYWDSNDGNPDFKVTSIDTATANRFMLNQEAIFTKDNNNYKMTACLLDASKWETFRDTRWADANNVIGSPTLEIWIASWNKKYTTETNTADKLYCNKASSTGYYVGTINEPTTTYIGSDVMSAKDSYKDTLYYPHTSEYNNCYGYWLASPSDASSNYEMIVGYNGGVGNDYYSNNNFGVRPLVHLKSGVKVKPQGEDFILVAE